MAGPRVYAAMARDHALPHQLAFHNKRGVPVLAVITQGVLGCLFVLVGDPDKLIRFVGFTLAVFAALAVAAVFILRARGMTSAYKTTGYPVTPLVFIALSVWIAYAQIKDRPLEAAAVGLVLAAGAGVYWFTTGRKPPVEEPAE